MGYVYILLTVVLSAYGQVILKWRMNAIGPIPESIDKWWFLFKAVFDPYIFSSFVAAFLASLTWMAALSKFELSFAYPFMSLSFLFVLVLSYFFLNEAITAQKAIGFGLIIVGLIIASR
jgi:uncharacterized membrane protein